VVPGEVLDLTMPTILQVVTAEEPEISGKMAPYACRISRGGTITLPVAGEIEVEGKTLAEIESAVTDAYHPEYTVTRPSVFARILEYKTAKVSVTGAVNKPGIYSLRSDQMSLVALLMEAEGIIDEGAAFLRIVHPGQLAPDKEAARIKRVDQPVEQLPQLNRNKLSTPLARRANSNNIEVQLKFRPPVGSGTKGVLTVSHGQRILLVERLDISSEIERKSLLERLIEREPRASCTVVSQRLCALAGLLRRGSGTWNSENGTASESAISIAKLDSDEVKSPAMSRESTSGKRWASTAGSGQRLYAPPASPKLGYGVRDSEYGAMSRNIGFYHTSDTDDSKQTPVVNKAVYEPHLKESSEIAGQVKSKKPQEPKSLILPVKGLNIPFADVALRDGDRVIVERLREPMITVVGLINKAGNFPYRPDVRYNLMQALAFAGGLNLSAEPRYATVYRLAADGTTVSTTFNIAGIAKSSDPTGALSVLLKPYDVVAVEHTPRTRAKVFWDRVFRFYVSTYIRPEEIFGDY
jgi:protein involved in polysaccharide export with SLBB domain